MPTNYNPYMQNFPNQYPVYNSYAPAGAMATPVMQGRPTMGGNVLGYQVDGEVGAKAYPFQTGSNEPLVLWDMNDSVFYLRSYNPSGFPNPLKRYRFVEEEMPQALPAGMSGNAMATADMSQMANKNEVEELRQEIQRLTMLVNQLQGHGTEQNMSGGPNFVQNGSHGSNASGNGNGNVNGGNNRGR